MPIYFLVFPFCVRGPGGFFFFYFQSRSLAVHRFPGVFSPVFRVRPPAAQTGPALNPPRILLYVVVRPKTFFCILHFSLPPPYRRYYCCEYGRFYFRSLLAVQREMARVGRPTAGTGGEKVMRNARVCCRASFPLERAAGHTRQMAVRFFRVKLGGWYYDCRDAVYLAE